MVKAAVSKRASNKIIDLDDALSWISAGAIMLFGIILKLIIKLLAKKVEVHSSHTNEALSIIKRLWKVIFLTNCIVPFLICTSTLNYFAGGGLLEEATKIMILNMFVSPIIDLFVEPDIWIRRIKNWKLNSFKEAMGKGRVHWPINQREAHNARRRLDFEIFEPYSYLLSTISTCLFYFEPVPIVIFLAIIGLIAVYWTWKVTIIDLTTSIFC